MNLPDGGQVGCEIIEGVEGLLAWGWGGGGDVAEEGIFPVELDVL